MPLVHCPTCDRSFDPEQSPAMPFCSERCRLLDLQGWLDEEFGLAYEGEENAEESGSEQ